MCKSSGGREALPKAKDQPPDAADDTGHTPGLSQGTAQTASTTAAASCAGAGEDPIVRKDGPAPVSPGASVVVAGARRISAEVPQPGDGGLFHGGPLTNRKKDTGGVGARPSPLPVCFHCFRIFTSVGIVEDFCLVNLGSPGLSLSACEATGKHTKTILTVGYKVAGVQRRNCRFVRGH